MKPSLILKTVSVGLLYVILIFSLFMFFRGHNHPGGGFIAGLIAGVMILLAYISTDRFTVDSVFKPVFHRLMALGLILAGLSGLFGVVGRDGYFASYKWILELPGFVELEVPSVLLFDLGVYFVVIGLIISVFLALDRDDPNSVREGDPR